jgi:hypothetical protein
MVRIDRLGAMRRLLRLLTFWLFALALPIHGAQAAVEAGHGQAPSHAMVMPDGHTMDAADMPGASHATSCHELAKSGCCGTCCGPIAARHERLAVAPAAVRWARLPRGTIDTACAQFLTGGTDRPPPSVLG